ncbi:MAG: winged helix-turn-helix domain-containing protein [Spirochaetaceae bacterium]|nr:winged helix-turn-helix domain-containing protein [Spirochaetaceae bacterium]
MYKRPDVPARLSIQYGAGGNQAGEYLRRWNYTPQKPVRYACERDPKKVKKWTENTCIEIKSGRKSKTGTSIGMTGRR